MILPLKTVNLPFHHHIKILIFLDTLVTIGDLYDINKMPDHRGSLFQHKHSKLIQLNISDTNNNLIPTYDLSKNLRLGTVIMAKCTIHCYISPGTYKSRKVPQSIYSSHSYLTIFPQTYQINADMIRILSDSEEPLSLHTEHNLPSVASSTPSSSTSTATAITKAITDFPRKKQKTNPTSTKQPNK
jgi:hypothetical protein